MTDPIINAARAAAERLADEYGPGLGADVEAALYARGMAERPGQYLDPLSLGTLIVAIATLAWTIYTDLRKKTSQPSPDVVTRQVRVELRKQGSAKQQEADRIAEIVVIEISNAAQDAC
jgi:hypothetical protein